VEQGRHADDHRPVSGRQIGSVSLAVAERAYACNSIKNLVKLQGGEYIALERLESTYKSCNLVVEHMRTRNPRRDAANRHHRTARGAPPRGAPRRRRPTRVARDSLR
jgi:hypothetical protein